LRIEDTDRARSTEPAIEAIFDGLNWLGSGGDEAPVFQFARSDRHAQVAAQMLESGHAYRCYLTQEELTAMREAAAAEKRPFRIASPWRDATPDQWPQDRSYVVRVKAPRDGAVTIADQVRAMSPSATRTRRFRHPAQRRHADLYAGRGGRRS
jgi:glutamyl-tRNA synthetase